ncbi:MAG: signal peptidase I [Pseudomonadota bacterium]
MADKAAENPIIELFKTVFWALLIAGVFRTLFFQPFWIPSGSMKDTLLIGDFLFVNKMVYGYSRHSCPFSICPFEGRLFGGDPERGDVVVFRNPATNTDFIKRLVGLPGDRIEMRDGVLFINDEPSPQVPDGVFEEIYEQQGPQGKTPFCVEGAVGVGGVCSKEKFIETFPEGTSHSILNIQERRTDNTGVFTVPAGHYFFMGDNRDNSGDSRTRPERGGIGFIPEDYLIGRADRVVFSSGGRSLFFVWTWRGDRFFKAIE